MAVRSKFVYALIFLFFLLSGLSANNAVPTQTLLQEEAVCPYVTPTNFQPIQRGSTWIRLGWFQPGAPPPFYNLKVFKVSTGALIQDITFPNTTTDRTVTGLEAFTEYRFLLCPLTFNFNCCCPPAESLGKTIIVDLIVDGREVDNFEDRICALNTADSPSNPVNCAFNGNPDVMTSFRVQKDLDPSHSRLFDVQYNSGGYIIVHPDPDGSFQFAFKCLNGFPQPECWTPTVIIFEPGNPSNIFAKIEFSYSGASDARIYCTVIQGDYEIVQLEPGNLPGNKPDNGAISLFDSRAKKSPSAAMLVSPNPFGAELSVKLPDTSTGYPTRTQLLNLQGQVVLTQEFPANQEVCNLSTSELIPGMYLLKVETGDRIETVKVLKTH